jgi:hypothetical protein
MHQNQAHIFVCDFNKLVEDFPWDL